MYILKALYKLDTNLMAITRYSLSSASGNVGRQDK